MESEGLVINYPTNRPISKEELDDHLLLKANHEITPHHQLSVIRSNSTFLEFVDKFFAWKGLVSTVALMATPFFIYAAISNFYSGLHSYFFGPLQGQGKWLIVMFSLELLIVLALSLTVWLLLKESFSLTHFPIRFNRKNRMVYAFRTDGTVLTAPWDELFFTLGRQPRGSGLGLWEVRAHVLDADGKTVRETFALPFAGERNEPMLLAQWEFIRRYMEDGPEDIVPRIEYLNRISTQRESFWLGFRRLWSEVDGLPLIIMVGFMGPFLFLVAIGRQFAKWTSRIPVWPEKVEEACAIEPGDPYLKE